MEGALGERADWARWLAEGGGRGDAPREYEALAEPAQQALVEASALYPEVGLPAETFARALGARLGVPPALERLQALHASDLYLAHAAAHGDPHALASLYNGPLAQVCVALGRAGIPDEQARDLVQHLFLHVLAPGEDGRVRLLHYQGKGELTGWLRVMATRELHRRQKRDRKTRAEVDAALLERVGVAQDAELAGLRRRYQNELKRAIEDALQALSPRERNLLRQQLLDGLEQEALGALYGVHRVTIARWLAAARARLQAETRRLLGERLGLDTEAFHSAVRLVRGELELSLAGALRPSEGDGDGGRAGEP